MTPEHAAAGSAVLIIVALAMILASLEREACCYNWLEPGFRSHVLEWHHGYLAILAGIPSRWIWIPALLIGLDDLYQHASQLAGRPLFRSPLHDGYARWLYPLEMRIRGRKE